MCHIDPRHGLFSTLRQFYGKNNEELSICQDFLKYISLDKFGNDNKNFAAVLINGHSDSRICEQLQRKIVSNLQDKHFTMSMVPEDIAKYIESILSKFEEKFLSHMSELSKKRDTLFRKMAKNQDPQKMNELTDLENQLNSGATISIVAVIQGNMYISNIGDNQVILVSKDNEYNDDCDQRFVLLTEEQSFHNEKELQRIKEDCGLKPDALRFLSILSTDRCHSRCIGDYEIKCNYNKFQNLREATSSPLISIPQPTKCIPLKDDFTHVLLISSGLYYLVRELIYDKDKVPGEITRKFFELKCIDSKLSLNKLCQSVVESFIMDHKQCYDQYRCLTDEDNAFLEYSHHDDLSLFAIEFRILTNQTHIVLDAANGFALVDSVSTNMSTAMDSLGGPESMNSMKDQFSSLKSSNNTSLTPIIAYVDFDDWQRALCKVSADELAFIDSIVESPESFGETITEESETQIVSRSVTLNDEDNSVVGSSALSLDLLTSLDD